MSDFVLRIKDVKQKDIFVSFVYMNHRIHNDMSLSQAS